MIFTIFNEIKMRERIQVFKDGDLVKSRKHPGKVYQLHESYTGFYIVLKYPNRVSLQHYMVDGRITKSDSVPDLIKVD